MRAGLLRRVTLRFGMLALACAVLFAVVAVPAGRGERVGPAVASSSGIGGGHGSGQPVVWQQKGKRISPDEQVRRVRREDGIVMFGDSISVQDGEALAKLLASRTGDSLATHNWSARPTGPAVDAVQQWSDDFGLPRRILICLGSNDIFEPSGFVEQVDRVMRIAGPDRTVFWVNIYVARTKQPAAVRLADQQNSQWLNAQLAAAQRRYPNLRIVPWAEFLAAEPQRPTTLLRDGVHPSVPVGQKARNALIIDTIRRG
ncbi:GDSL-type esterase/lipase family protein [Kribbella catacumbae]|uniref:GDSL-type esterase/lipase family protein n=1 Tax=Kribbella catacumbae TaxID=460086 RepID=UPI001ED9A481|nr:GDSL-type esterase/lipase family protein [Kribbella catacumbae]